MAERPRPPERPRPAGPTSRPVASGPAPQGNAVGKPKGPVGRGIRATQDEAPPPPTPPPARPHAGELSPFQRYGGAAPPAVNNASETVTVVGMIIGLVMAIGAVIAMVIILLFVGTQTGVIDVPGVSPEKKRTQDTDVQIAGPRAQPKASAPRAKAEEVVVEPEGPVAAREVSGTIVFDLQPGELFHTVEAKCPTTPNVRRRADIRGSRVSITLPNNEDCKLTFQGSLPASAYLRGGQTKTCTFNPTNCR